MRIFDFFEGIKASSLGDLSRIILAFLRTSSKLIAVTKLICPKGWNLSKFRILGRHSRSFLLRSNSLKSLLASIPNPPWASSTNGEKAPLMSEYFFLFWTSYLLAYAPAPSLLSNAEWESPVGSIMATSTKSDVSSLQLPMTTQFSTSTSPGRLLSRSPPLCSNLI